MLSGFLFIMQQLTDKKLLQEFKDCSLTANQFTHKVHIHVAYLYLKQWGYKDGSARFLTHLKQFTKAHGASTKYNAALSKAALDIIYERMCASTHIKPFETFLETHPDLQTNFKLLVQKRLTQNSNS